MARDRFHNVVRIALEKEGWHITDDPYEINVDDVNFEIDLAAEQLLAAERENRKIAVEIKSFTSSSNVSDFHTALGQFLNYRDALAKIEPERQLYLAVRHSIYETFFQRRFILASVERYQLQLLTYDVQKEAIVQWV
ncbi:MAG TPA: fatty-acid oxidation protein subunit alpha [Cyanobacteria bacterium UBA8803]|nr:fatty-acid oxidation protein subunit alpha [Cyanobacteria bacterium UBA9273]HBL58927.1 fatty-acid oxidation protein subunit alpha [Cyanobacteria bacterium UBA8803]